MLYTLKKILRIIEQYKARMLQVFCAYGILILLDIISLSLLSKFVSGISNNLDFEVRSNSLFDLNFDLSELALFLALLFLIRIILGIAANYFIYLTSGFIEADVRMRLMNAYSSLEFEQRMSLQTSDLQARINIISPYMCRICIQQLIRSMGELFLFIGVVLYLIYVNPFLLFIFIMLAVAAATLYIGILRGLSAKLSAEYHLLTENISNSVNEVIFGFKVVRSYGVYSFFESKIRSSLERFQKVQAILSIITNSSRYILEATFILFLVITYLSYTSGIFHTDTLISLAVFSVGGYRLTTSINAISTLVSVLNAQRHSIETIYHDLLEYDVFSGSVSIKKDIDLEGEDHSSAASCDVAASPKRFVIECRNASFIHRTEQKPSFRDVSFDIRNGDKIAICGPSGSGKSTLVEVLLGFIEPTVGSLAVRDLQDNSTIENRECLFSYVPQDQFLISGSIFENITLGKFKSSKQETMLLIEKSLKRAGALDFLQNDVDGIFKTISNGGSNLSGGQKQRLLLARAFYHDRPIVVLDEATTGIDETLETKIVDNLLQQRDLTLIYVTHNEVLLKKFTKKIRLTL